MSELAVSGTIAVVLLSIAAVVYGRGRAKGSRHSPPTSTPPATEPHKECKEACAAWDDARQRQCGARADEQAARIRADAIRRQFLAMNAVAVALAAAAAGVAAAAAVATATIVGIPVGAVLEGIAIALGGVALAMFSKAADLAGQLAAAESDAATKAGARQAWDTTVANLRIVVHRVCKEAEAKDCLSRPAPC